MCYAWMMGAAKLGMHFVAMGPEELAKQMDKDVVNSTFAEARENGGLIEITDNKADLKGADVIYGDVWASMGEEAQIPERVRLLSPFRVTEETLKATENPDVLYLHCLPADITGLSCPEGEVDNSVFDRYIVPLYKQASYKPYIIAAMIFMSQVKDPVRTLMAMDEGNGKRKSF